ncbi:LysR family transcriptional regulator [Paenibacillus macerans]|uniref:LysR family transcriptional regulator n=1 Tax=Paenibacillus macerans TaxID=44252 RepID=UPI00203AEA5D|nr:LysR family transcriptional regulator [Paenibacillus macerans]MCM3699626.1 LysR family transcriptional regulator [Paenibacillus macerans]
METRDWRILQELYKHRNITKTAQSLFMSQPTLTARIQQIEKEFDITIVQRGRRGVDFTPQGEYMAKAAEEMIKKYQKIKDDLLNLDDQVTGTLRLGVGYFFTKNKLPGVLKMFKELYPEVEYKVITGRSKSIHNMIFNRDIHIGFVRGDYTWNEGKHLLFQDTLCVVSKEPLTLDELPDRPRIDYITDFVLKAEIDNWWSDHYSVPPKVGMEVDHADSAREMVLSGLGYAIMPGLYFSGEPLMQIQIKNKKGEPIIRRTFMFYHEESLQLNQVRAFVHFMKTIDFNKSL